MWEVRCLDQTVPRLKLRVFLLEASRVCGDESTALPEMLSSRTEFLDSAGGCPLPPPQSCAMDAVAASLALLGGVCACSQSARGAVANASLGKGAIFPFFETLTLMCFQRKVVSDRSVACPFGRVLLLGEAVFACIRRRHARCTPGISVLLNAAGCSMCHVTRAQIQNGVLEMHVAGISLLGL